MFVRLDFLFCKAFISTIAYILNDNLTRTYLIPSHQSCPLKAWNDMGADMITWCCHSPSECEQLIFLNCLRATRSSLAAAYRRRRVPDQTWKKNIKTYTNSPPRIILCVRECCIVSDAYCSCNWITFLPALSAGKYDIKCMDTNAHVRFFHCISGGNGSCNRWSDRSINAVNEKV